MGRDVRVDVSDVPTVRATFDEVCALYTDVFSAPPFCWGDEEPARHRDRLAALLVDPTFGVALAHDGGRLVGFAYGFTLPLTTTWWVGLVPRRPATMTTERPGRTFVLFDFAVRAEFRGRGIGKALHDTLLGSRTERRATLATQPAAVETKRIYERWGWRLVGRVAGGPTSVAPLFDIYLRTRIDDLAAPDDSRSCSRADPGPADPGPARPVSAGPGAAGPGSVGPGSVGERPAGSDRPAIPAAGAATPRPSPGPSAGTG
jgi:GNAT superfamily N-acetyltransferase